jgi:prolipoprotein diacylglyceryltransferase
MLTMGQVLSLPMVAVGVAMLVLAYRRNEPSGNRSPGR